MSVIVLSAWGSGAHETVSAALPATVSNTEQPLPTGLPQPVVVAQVPGVTALALKLPIATNAVTAIGYHGAACLALTPYGHRANEGVLSRFWHHVFGGNKRGLRYFQVGGGKGPATAELDVGAAPGTDVYSPIDGTVVGMTPLIVDGTQYGVRLDVRADAAPSIVVSLSHLAADPSLTVGSALTASVSRVGQVVALSGVEHESLARYTQDKGDHLALCASQQTQTP